MRQKAEQVGGELASSGVKGAAAGACSGARVRRGGTRRRAWARIVGRTRWDTRREAGPALEHASGVGACVRRRRRSRVKGREGAERGSSPARESIRQEASGGVLAAI